jgi:uncharacterized membrane protein
MIWAAVLWGSLGCFLLKALGYLLPERTLDTPDVRKAAGLMPVALLAALVAVQTFGQGQDLVIDGRLIGLLAAIVALLLRAPFLVVVVVAAVTAALLRSAGFVA